MTAPTPTSPRDPDENRSEGGTPSRRGRFSCQCGRRWRAFRDAHCAGCHRHFGSVHAFDIHRVGDQCSDPATITTRDQRRNALKAVDGPDGRVWVTGSDRPHWQTRDRT